MTRCFPGQLERAFTLVEIALALGVAAFALVAILGMLPVAMENSRESRLQTRAVFLGRAIFDDLKSGGDGKGMVQKSDTGSASDFEVVDAATPFDRTFTLAYNLDGKLLGAAGNYQTGTGMPSSAIYVARLHLVKAADKPLSADLSIETPAVASKANRKVYPFKTTLFP